MSETAPKSSKPETNGRKSVLVVEDEVLIRSAIAEHLRDSGFDVIEAANASEAMTVLNVRNGAVDVVFTDINMPGGTTDGFGLAAWIAEQFPRLPVLFTSALASAWERPEGRPFVGKPYAVDQVVKHLEDLLGRAPGIDA